VLPPIPQSPSITTTSSPKAFTHHLAMCLAISSGVTDDQLSSSIKIPLSYFEKK